MKLSNTSKHLRVAIICGILALILLQFVNTSIRAALGWCLMMLWTAGTVAFEYYQYWHYGQKSDYWQNRGWDTIVDLLAGNLPFWGLCVIGMYGHYAGNVLRP